MTVSNIQRMSESSKVEGKGTAAAVESTSATTSKSPEIEGEGGGGGGAPEKKESTLGRLELAHI